MKTTIGELREKFALVQNVSVSTPDKLSYTLKKFKSRLQDLLKEPTQKIQDRINDYRIDQAATDDKGILIIGPKGDTDYSFKPDDYKKVIAEVARLNKEFEATVVEFEPVIIADVDAAGYERVKAAFDEFTIEELEGFLFPKKAKTKE